jgi:predicted Fe-Mo cluster-binding NifX family protein
LLRTKGAKLTMKIAVSAMGTDLGVQVDPRFGRCQCFIIVDSDTLEFEAIENPNIGTIGGAGIQSGQLMAERGVQVVLTGNVGPNAFQALSVAGLQIITGVTGTVKAAIQRLNSGQLRPVSRAAMSDRPGAGMSGGSGRGMRRRMGPRAQSIVPPSGDLPQQQPATSDQELRTLKDQAEAMKQQLDRIANKIEDMEKK